MLRFERTKMKKLARKYRAQFVQKEFLLSFFASLLFFSVALVINFYAGLYANENASNSVTDIVLDNIPVFSVDEIFIYGPVVFWTIVGLFCLWEPKKFPFVLKSIALFTVIRSLFITLTHLGPSPDQLIIDYSSDFIKKFTFGADLFFSGHTGLPFLMALVFGKNHQLRNIFTVVAIFFGIIVLMAHVHYSIDVLSAFFITYTIYHIAVWLFPKDHTRFNS